ncbi:hypothetical protein BDW59DRAFT_173854 [Aspergillus cavernicola]|uniref:Uncharacterized protein n=1 Tax=Aspergillus cavernicola TaxID=176166 RepID=A0ABR4I3K2_9EURO
MVHPLPSENSKTENYPPSLAHVTLMQAYREPEKHIESPFVCGGSIKIDHKVFSYPRPQRKTSPPVNVSWTTGTSSAAHKLLVKDCEPAKFGSGQEEIFVPEYCKASKMDPDHFATSFNLADFGIIENVERILLPSGITDEQDSLGFQKLSAELYKLNMYSGPSGLFHKHVDTPRVQSLIGSLVVCLPSTFKRASSSFSMTGSLLGGSGISAWILLEW